MIDQDNCAGILDITSGYVYYPAEDNSAEDNSAEDSEDVGYGEVIFTLTATGFGRCAFRIEYAHIPTFTME